MLSSVVLPLPKTPVSPVPGMRWSAAAVRVGAGEGGGDRGLGRAVWVSGAGHCVRRDQPARYLRAVDAFLAEVAQAYRR